MKKKDLTQLTVRQLISELRAKAGGVINAGYRVETREEYVQYLDEILEELKSRDLSDEEQEELKKLFEVDDSDEDDSDEDDSNKDDSTEDDSDKDDSTDDDSNKDDSDEDDSDKNDSDEDDSNDDDSDEDDSDKDDSNEDDSDEDDSDDDDSDKDDSDKDDSDKDDSDKDDSDEDDSDEDDSDDDDSDEDDSDDDDSDKDDSDDDDSDKDDSNEDDSDEDDSDEDDSNEKPTPKPKPETKNESVPGWLRWIPWLVALGIILALIALLSQCNGNSNDPIQNPNVDNPGINGNQPDNPADDQPSDNEFDMSAFVNAVVNIAEKISDDDDVAANADIFCENIGKDNLVEMIDAYDELTVQKAVAQFLVFVPEIKMQQYIINNELDYNPNAANDYDLKLQAADEAYRLATGKNPDGALMSLAGYDTHKANRDAIKDLIVKSGDLNLLTWYTVKTEQYDVMKQQQRDTEAAEAYKNEVKLELVNSEGTIELLKLQLKKEANATLKVMDDITMKYTEQYDFFILSNYMYVVAKP